MEMEMEMETEMEMEVGEEGTVKLKLLCWII